LTPKQLKILAKDINIHKESGATWALFLFSKMKKHFIITLLFSFNILNIQAQNLNIDILRKIYTHRNQGLDPAMNLTSNSVAPAAILIPLSFIGKGLIKKDSASTRKGIFIASAIITGTVISGALKIAVNEPRPFVTYSYIQNVGPKVGRYSFPSGHTTQAFSLATSLSIAHPKWYVIAPASIYAIGVGYSRVHLGAHYPGDVLAGAIIGTGSAFLSHRLNKWFYNTRR
jgi:membrane-associated phospholipid phosphatase